MLFVVEVHSLCAKIVGKCLDLFISIVEFETRQDAIRALKTLNDSELQGRLIYLREVWFSLSRVHFSPYLTILKDREDRDSPPPPPRRTFTREAPHFARDAHVPRFTAPHGVGGVSHGAGGAGCQVFVHNISILNSS